MSDIKIFKATIKDDAKEIAKLVYDTDPYIYPQFSITETDAINMISEMIKSDDTIFSYKNCILAKDGEKIVGLIVFLNNADMSNDYSKWNNSPEMDHVIKSYILAIKEECEGQDFVYISNVSVNPDYRGQGIATRMMEFLFELYPDHQFLLEVLKENDNVVRLYQNRGFVITDEYKGFNKKHAKKPLVYKMKKD